MPCIEQAFELLLVVLPCKRFCHCEITRVVTAQISNCAPVIHCDPVASFSYMIAQGILVQWPASLMVPSLTPYDLPFPPKLGFHMPATYANGHISATGDPIHFMFGYRVGFSGTADRTALFTIRTNPGWQPPPCWQNFKWRYLRNRSSDPRHVLF